MKKAKQGLGVAESLEKRHSLPQHRGVEKFRPHYPYQDTVLGRKLVKSQVSLLSIERSIGVHRREISAFVLGKQVTKRYRTRIRRWFIRNGFIEPKKRRPSVVQLRVSRGAVVFGGKRYYDSSLHEWNGKKLCGTRMNSGHLVLFTEEGKPVVMLQLSKARDAVATDMVNVVLTATTSLIDIFNLLARALSIEHQMRGTIGERRSAIIRALLPGKKHVKIVLWGSDDAVPADVVEFCAYIARQGYATLYLPHKNLTRSGSRSGQSSKPDRVQCPPERVVG